MALSGGYEGSVDERSLKELLFLEVTELFQAILEEVQEHFTVLFEDESVVEDAHALVDPESGKSEVIATIVSGIGLHHVLDDFREVSQVELVVELSGSGHELR